MPATRRVSTPLAGLAAGIAVMFIFSGIAPVPISGSSGPLHPTRTEDRTTTEQPRSMPGDGAATPWRPEPTVSIPVGVVPTGAACDDATGNVYVANGDSANVSVINGTTNTVTNTIVVGGAPEGMTYVAQTGYIYVTNLGSPNLSVINGPTDKLVGSIPVASGTSDVAYDPMNAYLYVANIAYNNVEVLNITTNQSVTNISVGTGPEHVAVDVATGYVYVSNVGSANVSVINGTTNHVVVTIPTTSQPGGIAYDAANGYVYVANGNGNVTVINGTTNQVVELIPVPFATVSAAYDSANGQIYIGTDTESVAVINGTTNTVLGLQPVGEGPYSLAYDPLNGYVYAANLGSDNVTAIGAIPPLASVSIAPSPAVIATAGAQLFTTAIVCSRGICPAGATYAWSLSNSLASLNSTTGATVRVTAGPGAGSVTLVVNVTQNSLTVGASVLVSIVPGLTSLTISPSTADLSTGAGETFTATPVCSAGPCPSGVTYFWSLSNFTLGSLSTFWGPSVDFQAIAAGRLSIDVNATALNQTIGMSAAITIVSPPFASIGPFSLTESEVIYLAVGIAAGVAVLAVLAVRKYRPRNPSSGDTPP
jgi:YVTN family beta-propeller protein